jgi:hypothetical protein
MLGALRRLQAMIVRSFKAGTEGQVQQWQMVPHILYTTHTSEPIRTGFDTKPALSCRAAHWYSGQIIVDKVSCELPAGRKAGGTQAYRVFRQQNQCLSDRTRKHSNDQRQHHHKGRI